MKKLLMLQIVLILIVKSNIYGQFHPFSIGGYGEMVFQRYDYGPNRLASPKGALNDERQIFDIPRFVLEISSNLSKDTKFTTEIEFEHGGTGSALELEYEEFGEFEMEQEKGGEVVLEQFHITKTFSEAFNLRAGHFIVGLGQLNAKHLPTEYFTSVRPESEQSIIPVTWHETGLEIFGRLRNFDYRLQVVNGLDANGFSSANWIKSGYQKKFELTKATNLAYIFRLEYSGFKGLTIGVSGYTGKSVENVQKPENMKGIYGTVTIGSVHAEFNRYNVILRGNYIEGNLEDSDKISSINRKLSKNAQYPQTPVAKGAKAWAIEAGYDFNSFLKLKNQKMILFARYEYYNTMEKVVNNFQADNRYKRNLTTIGINYYPQDNLVLKLDYSMRELGDGNYNNENTIGFSIGFAGEFFSI